ncbi:dynein axonemal heavy chain 3-like isoform X2 [Homarus americanus]|uniref:dynein axonemal heavy chain 3-like isoform X2 n=1 Tax=Homarus americanus TaxID=6706 RepID=UPI001C48AD86|nr:dynein axonemal heavy chain 3-like isoform X2 [Homarus americanus]
MLCQVMEAVCVMLDLKPERKPDPNGSGKMIEDYWAPSQKLLGDMKFLQNLLHYDKENIPTKIITHVRNEFYSHPDFDPKKIRMVSMACEGLCRWVRAMVVYDQVIKIVAPKKQALEAANHELAPQNERLEEKRKELREAKVLPAVGGRENPRRILVFWAVLPLLLPHGHTSELCQETCHTHRQD